MRNVTQGWSPIEIVQVGLLFTSIAIWAVICLAFALIPEVAMYLVWDAVDPSAGVEKIALVGVLGILGLGLCVIFGVLGVVAFFGGLALITKVI